MTIDSNTISTYLYLGFVPQTENSLYDYSCVCSSYHCNFYSYLSSYRKKIPSKVMDLDFTG